MRMMLIGSVMLTVVGCAGAQAPTPALPPDAVEVEIFNESATATLTCQRAGLSIEIPPRKAGDTRPHSLVIESMMEDSIPCSWGAEVGTIRFEVRHPLN